TLLTVHSGTMFAFRVPTLCPLLHTRLAARSEPKAKGQVADMEREKFYAQMAGGSGLDYELYLNTGALLACQKPFSALCNHDELQFQIVHQVEELWMKLIAYTLLDIDEQLAQAASYRVLSLFGRCHRVLRLIIPQLELLETLPPKEY